MQKKWILIRGLVRGVGHWSHFPEKIKAAFPQDDFEFVEIPGNGTLHKEKSPTHMHKMVAAVRQQSQFLKQGHKVHIVAVSLGGMIATAWADRYPNEIEKLVLINSSSAKHSKVFERLRPKNYLKMAKLALGYKTRYSIAEIEREILKMNVNSSESLASALPSWTKESEAHPIPIDNLIRQLIAAMTYQFPEKPPVPAVLLASENDNFVSVNCSKNLAKAWSCPIHFHPWAGHDLPVDDPEWVLNQLHKI